MLKYARNPRLNPTETHLLIIIKTLLLYIPTSTICKTYLLTKPKMYYLSISTNLLLTMLKLLSSTLLRTLFLTISRFLLLIVVQRSIHGMYNQVHLWRKPLGAVPSPLRTSTTAKPSRNSLKHTFDDMFNNLFQKN